MMADIAVDALSMAWFRRKPAPGLINHPDRGSQYASRAFQARLKEYSMTCSMSRKGNCWDNAPAESFFSSLKNEQVHGCRYRTREEARIDLSGYIEPFYNRKRWHSAPGYLSPAGFMARPGWKEPHDSFVLVGEKPRKSHFQRCPANWH